MGYLKEQVSYIRGMADGLSMDSSTKEGKLILAMISLLNEIADSAESNETSVDELTEAIEAIKDDIDCLESRIYGEELDDFSPWCEDDEEDDDPGFVEMVCPHCNDTIFFDSGLIESKEALVCPSCERPFQESEEK